MAQQREYSPPVCPSESSAVGEIGNNGALGALAPFAEVDAVGAFVEIGPIGGFGGSFCSAPPFGKGRSGGICYKSPFIPLFQRGTIFAAVPSHLIQDAKAATTLAALKDLVVLEDLELLAVLGK